MSIKVLIGDLFTSKMQTWMNTVNTVGVMGKGIALEFKKRFPEMYHDYARRCEAKQVKLGQPYLYLQLTPPWILNFPTKDHWRSVTRLDDIVRGLEFLSRHYKEWGITSLAVPPLGCGEGRLEWRVVGPTLYRHLGALDIPIELYAPFQTPHEELKPVFLEQSSGEKAMSNLPAARIGPAWIALAEIISRIDKEPYHWPIGRTLFQKIAYFATQAGIPTGLRYEQGSYGPYSADMKPIISALVNNSVLEERRTSPEARMLQVRTGPTFDDARKAYSRDLENWENAIVKTVDLFLRLEKTRNAELAATVHFAAHGLEGKHGSKPTELEILDAVKSWKQRRKPPFRDKEIALTIRSLATLSWLSARASEGLPVSEEEFLSA